MELHFRTVSVADIVSQVASTVEPLIAKKQMKIAIDVEGAGHIVADEGKVRQIVLNLVSNAIKFTADEGVITIRAAQAGDRLQIEVADNGIGIAADDIKRIFHELQQ